jgi:multidrug efflux pump subunit AcrB
MDKPKALAIWDACKEIAFPKLLILLCILAVFAPAFTMSGIPGALFLPLAMAIAFAMITSYFLAQTFVPIMANWMMKAHHHKSSVDGHILTDEEEYQAWTVCRCTARYRIRRGNCWRRNRMDKGN